MIACLHCNKNNSQFLSRQYRRLIDNHRATSCVVVTFGLAIRKVGFRQLENHDSEGLIMIDDRPVDGQDISESTVKDTRTSLHAGTVRI